MIFEHSRRVDAKVFGIKDNHDQSPVVVCEDIRACDVVVLNRTSGAIDFLPIDHNGELKLGDGLIDGCVFTGRHIELFEICDRRRKVYPKIRRQFESTVKKLSEDNTLESGAGILRSSFDIRRFVLCRTRKITHQISTDDMEFYQKRCGVVFRIIRKDTANAADITRAIVFE